MLSNDKAMSAIFLQKNTEGRWTAHSTFAIPACIRHTIQYLLVIYHKPHVEKLEYRLNWALMIKARSASSSPIEPMLLFIPENRAKCSTNLFNQKKIEKKTPQNPICFFWAKTATHKPGLMVKKEKQRAVPRGRALLCTLERGQGLS